MLVAAVSVIAGTGKKQHVFIISAVTIRLGCRVTCAHPHLTRSSISGQDNQNIIWLSEVPITSSIYHYPSYLGISLPDVMFPHDIHTEGSHLLTKDLLLVMYIPSFPSRKCYVHHVHARALFTPNERHPKNALVQREENPSMNDWSEKRVTDALALSRMATSSWGFKGVTKI